jgi:membrane protease YdiL (CAAX protease family)
MEAAASSISTRVAAHPVEAPRERTLPQLGLRRIITVWAAAALPMALLAWVVSPLLADQFTGAARLPRALIVTLTAGLIWQFALVMILVAREQRTLRWSVLREALWLRSPRSPRSGRRGGLAWLIVIPLLVGFGLEEVVPSLPYPGSHDLPTFLSSHAGHVLLQGAWGWFAVLAAMVVFNTVLGEELLFRGYLLPRMNGTFGERDWVANGVLFAAYHLHMPWVIPSALLDTFFISYPSKRYRSALIGIVVHSAQSVVLLGLALSLVVKG